MSPRTTLTPVPITDKNGVQSIRWKRADKASPSGRAIPPATVQEAQSQDQIARETIDRRRAVSKSFPFHAFHGDSFYDYADMEPKMSKGEAIDRYLALPQRTREAIDSIGARGDSTFNAGMILVKLLARDVDEKTIDNVATYMAGTDELNFQFLQTMFSLEDGVDLQYQPIQIDISGLKYYRLNGFSYDDELPISDHDEHTQEQIAALFKLHSLGHLLDDYYGYENRGKQPVKVTINNIVEPYWLAQYAVQNVDKVDHLMQVITDRRSSDREMIMSVMENEASSLSEGVL